MGREPMSLRKLFQKMAAAIGRNSETAVFSNAVFLMFLQIVVFFLALMAVIAVSLFTPAQNRAFYLVLTIGCVLIASVAHVLNLSGKYALSLVLTLGILHAAPWLSILHEQLIGSGDCIPMVYIVIPTQISALFLSEKAMIPIAVAQTAAFVCLVLTDPNHQRYNWVSLICFVLFASALGAFTSFMYRRQYDKTLRSKKALEENEKILRDISERDSLSGLYNRRHMEEALHQLTQSGRARFGAAMLDVDGFKAINDVYGHVCGDQLIRELAGALTEYLREGDIAYRYGGPMNSSSSFKMPISFTRPRVRTI